MNQTILGPRDSGQLIADKSKDVKISMEGVKKTARKIYEEIKKNPKSVDVDRWKLGELNPTTADQAAIDWVFFADVLNFSFWMEPGAKFQVNYKGKSWTGYWSLCAAMNRALDEGIPITDPKYYCSITDEQLRYVMRSDTQHQMPMIEQRLQHLHQSGTKIVQDYGGSFANVLAAATGSAQQLLQLVVKEFPSFRDEADFEGQRVGIYKRVQILIGDIWASCGGKGLGAFQDIDSITMFADYRIPQALVWFEALKYSDALMGRLNNKDMFTSGERQEVEIRGCTIWAVELIVAECRKLLQADPDSTDPCKVNAITVDHFLWDFRQEHDHETDSIPIHRIRCIYY